MKKAIKLLENEIDVRAFFIPLSEMKIYQRFAQNCRKSKQISKMGLNLPTTYKMDLSEIKKIKNIIVETL